MAVSANPTSPEGGPPTPLAVQPTDSFVEWLARFPGSIMATTYQANKVIVFGHDGRQMTVLPRNFDKPMGMHVSGNRLALATRHDVLVLANAPALAHDYLENQPGRYDAIWLPRVAYHTGDLHLHDLAFGADGIWLVNTRYCCLAWLSDEYNFVPVWKPKFLTEIVPEDRCHLNGLCMIDSRPAFVTVLGETDVVGGWRSGKAVGGAVLHVETNEVVVRGLAMPHSPRWHDGKLWVLNSGAGEFGVVDPNLGKFTPVCSLPGYLRGLTFVGDHALIGLCMVRERHLFGGLPVQQRYPRLLCGIALVDLKTGQPVGLCEFTSGVTELFEVQAVLGGKRPTILNLEREAARQAFIAPNLPYWLRPSRELPAGEDKTT